MSRKVMIGGEEKGDWFDAVLSWATPAKPSKPSTAPAPPPATSRKPKEEVKKAARAIKTREQLLPTNGPSEPHVVVAPAPPVHVSETETEEPPARTEPARPLVYHSCGHLSWASPEQDEAARAEGKCCGNAKHQANWAVRGLTVPVPENQRRTLEKERSMGWPGLCCDPETGLYIGGVGNDCRHNNSGKARCVVHAAPVPAPVVTDGGEEGEKRVASRSPRSRKERTA